MTSGADMKEANTSRSIEDGNFEYFWGCELSKDKPSVTWTCDEEEGDTDFLIHTLFLKGATLGADAVKGERNIVRVETQNYDGESLSIPLFSLTLGLNDCCFLDTSFAQRVPATLRLVQGAGPVCISAQHLTEFPPDSNFNDSQEDLYVAEINTEDEEEDSPLKKATKRKAAQLKATKSKKGKLDASLEEDEDESMEEEDEQDEVDEEDEDEEEEEEEEEDEDEEEEDSPPKKGAKGKAKKNVKGGKAAANGSKAKKPVKAANGKTAAAKKGKKAKA